MKPFDVASGLRMIVLVIAIIISICLIPISEGFALITLVCAGALLGMAITKLLGELS